MHAHQEQLLDRVDRLALIRAATRREVYRRVARATDLLHSNYANGIDLAALAATANMSKYHFLRLFKLVHGLTPHTYLQRKRIGVAVRLLESTRLTVREVAINVGLRRRLHARAPDAALDAAHAGTGSRRRCRGDHTAGKLFAIPSRCPVNVSVSRPRHAQKYLCDVPCWSRGFRCVG